jgi:hypothetical protein
VCTSMNSPLRRDGCECTLRARSNNGRNIAITLTTQIDGVTPVYNKLDRCFGIEEGPHFFDTAIQVGASDFH